MQLIEMGVNIILFVAILLSVVDFSANSHHLDASYITIKINDRNSNAEQSVQQKDINEQDTTVTNDDYDIYWDTDDSYETNSETEVVTGTIQKDWLGSNQLEIDNCANETTGSDNQLQANSDNSYLLPLEEPFDKNGSDTPVTSKPQENHADECVYGDCASNEGQQSPASERIDVDESDKQTSKELEVAKEDAREASGQQVATTESATEAAKEVAEQVANEDAKEEKKYKVMKQDKQDKSSIGRREFTSQYWLSNVIIKAEEIKILDSDEWLDDNIINAYMSKIQKRYSDIFIYDAHFFTYLVDKLKTSIILTEVVENDQVLKSKHPKPIDLLKYRLLLMPVHESDRSHWTLVSINTQSKTISMLDSLHKPAKHILKTLTYFFGILFNQNASDWSVEIPDVPLQTNSFDCGVFVCKFAECLAKQEPMYFKQDDMRSERQKIKQLLIEDDPATRAQ